jgi:hypothetical protein
MVDITGDILDSMGEVGLVQDQLLSFLQYTHTPIIHIRRTIDVGSLVIGKLAKIQDSSIGFLGITKIVIKGVKDERDITRTTRSSN